MSTTTLLARAQEIATHHHLRHANGDAHNTGHGAREQQSMLGLLLAVRDGGFDRTDMEQAIRHLVDEGVL